jgi:hypothetical protein
VTAETCSCIVEGPEQGVHLIVETALNPVVSVKDMDQVPPSPFDARVKVSCVAHVDGLAEELDPALANLLNDLCGIVCLRTIVYDLDLHDLGGSGLRKNT